MNEFNDKVEKFIKSLKENSPEIYYQAFDFSNVNDSRTELTKLNYDKDKVSFVNIEMIADMFQVFTAVHSVLEQNSSRDFSVEVPHQLSNSRSITDALRTFGGFGKPYIVVVSIHDKERSDEFFERISKINNVKKLTYEQMQQFMNKNIENIQKYYFGAKADQTSATSLNPVGDIVTKMIASKTL